MVLHGVATAVFQTPSFADAAQLAAAVAEVPGLGSTNTVVTVSGTNFSVGLTRDMWNLNARYAEFALRRAPQRRQSEWFNPVAGRQ